MYCQGSGNVGQLGLGASTFFTVDPTDTGLAGATQLALGDGFTCALVGTDVWCTGDNNRGQLGRFGIGLTYSTFDTVLGLSAQSITAGFEHACAVSDRQIDCWGRGDSGQLGDGNTGDAGYPNQVTWVPPVTT